MTTPINSASQVNATHFPCYRELLPQPRQARADRILRGRPADSAIVPDFGGGASAGPPLSDQFEALGLFSRSSQGATGGGEDDETC